MKKVKIKECVKVGFAKIVATLVVAGVVQVWRSWRDSKKSEKIYED